LVSSPKNEIFLYGTKNAVVKPLQKYMDNTILEKLQTNLKCSFHRADHRKVVFKQVHKLEWILWQYSIWFPAKSQHRDIAHKNNKWY